MTIREAADKFDTDAAGVWELVAEGVLIRSKERDAEGRWSFEVKR